MSYVHFAFDTPGFKDSAETKAENINELAGCALAKWLAGQLAARGLKVSEVWPEDHGWDFSVSHDGRRTQCACSINDDEAELGDAHVVLGPKVQLGDAVCQAVEAELRSCADVKNLTSEATR